MRVTLMLFPCAMQSSIAPSPGFVAGIFTYRFGGSSHLCTRIASSKVPSRSYASVGSTSHETKPSCGFSSCTFAKRSSAASTSRAESCRKISFGSVSSASSSLICSSYASPEEIAFWKMVGFVVTPTTASSFISRLSSPLSSIVRESESIQTDWPRLLSLCRFDSAIAHLPFHRFNFFQSPYITLATVESCPEKRAHELDGEAGADHLGTEAEDVHVVMLDALVRGVDVMADRS